jgi:hypothetical protein
VTDDEHAKQVHAAAAALVTLPPHLTRPLCSHTAV